VRFRGDARSAADRHTSREGSYDNEKESAGDRNFSIPANAGAS
jgi:hypothetical protein